MQWSALQCSAVQCSAYHYSAVQCSTVQSSEVQCCAVQCSALQPSAVECSVVQYIRVHWILQKSRQGYRQERDNEDGVKSAVIILNSTLATIHSSAVCIAQGITGILTTLLVYIHNIIMKSWIKGCITRVYYCNEGFLAKK